ncbi:MAG: hypothetical protein HYY16_13765 [Planctomycetes bacterium]|nr:hypothetical protein [Planctomycetota bacterium]
MAAEIQRKRCANHPERYGHALCMTCGKVVCQECATPWDGINYCASCLARRRQGARKGGSALSWAALAATIVLLFFAARTAMVWGAGLLVSAWP